MSKERILSSLQIKMALQHMPAIVTVRAIAEYFELDGNDLARIRSHLKRARLSGWLEEHRRSSSTDWEWRNLLAQGENK